MSTSSNPSLTMPLTGSGVGGEVVGGKAEALDRLIGLGLPVPSSGVVTAAAYRQFVSAPPLRRLLEDLTSSPVPSPSEHAAARTRVDDAFLATPLPELLAAEIDELAVTIGGGGDLAIRSSATAEDLEGASFAGQYRSFLGVEPAEVADAVRLTWASLWHPAPRIYRRFRSLDEADLAMAVILMAMLDPTEAGVLFTADPGGSEHSLRVEVVRGLGEALVSGASTPEVIVVPRSTAVAELGQRSRPLADLARLGLEVEAATGVAQDIEWAIERGRLQLLQARPITTVSAHARPDDPFDTDDHADTAYTTSGIAEMVPGLLPPRLWEMNSWALEEAFRRLFASLGASVPAFEQPHALLARFRGRAALDLDHMRIAVASVSGGSPRELEREYFGRALHDDGEAPGSGKSGLGAAARAARARLSSVEEAALVVRTAERLTKDEVDLTALGDDELVAYRSRVVHLVTRTISAEVAVAAMATAAYRGVERRLERDLDRDEASALARRLAGRVGGRSSLAQLLDELSTELESVARLDDETDWPSAQELLEGTPEGRRFLERLRDDLRRAGSVSVCGGEPWSERPEEAWKALVMGRRAAIPEIGAATRQTAPSGGRWLRREAAAAGELLRRREQAKAAVMMVGGLLWRADRELGRRLEARGRLEAVGDIDLVVEAEMRALLAGAGPTMAEIAHRRRRLDEQSLDGPLPQLFRGAPTPARRSPVLAERFSGWAASAGRFEGPARLVQSSAGSGLRRGEVLVARSTDASWAPLFLIAGAVVVEEGGPLSHAAIVARELGVPAVINVPGIVDRLEREAGRVALIVDGESGEVLVHRQAGGGAESNPSVPGGSTGGPTGDGVAAPSQPPPGIDLGRLNVFVTGLIGVGVVMSAVLTMTQAISGRRLQQRLAARAEAGSAMLAAGVVKGFDQARSSPAGLHSRAVYRWGALGAGAIAVMLLAHGVARAGADTKWSPLWQAMSLTAGVEVGVGAALLWSAARWWPAVPPILRRLPPPVARSRPTWAETLGRPGSVVVAGSLTLLLVLTLLVRFAEGSINRFDRWIYDALGAGTEVDRWGPEWIDLLGSSEVIVPVALFVAVTVWRCRPLALAIPATIAIAGLAHLGLGRLAPRDRPSLGESAGGIDSFPGGFVLEVTLVLGFLPLAVAVLTRRPALWSYPISAILWIVLVADAVRLGAHWPTDNLAGLALGTVFLTAVHRMARTPGHHLRCPDCPSRPAPLPPSVIGRDGRPLRA